MTDMLSAILAGTLTGLILSVMIGPVFFALLQASIEKGFLSGLMFAIGIVCSDSLYFTLAYLGISQIGGLNTPTFQIWMGSIGGLFLLGFGWGLITKKPKRLKREKHVHSKSSLARNMIKGFLLNALNPAVMLYWLAVVGNLHVQFEGNNKSIFAFFICCMLVVFSTDITKANLAQRLKKFITPRRMMWMNRVSGIVVVIFGLRLLVGGIFLFFDFHPFR